MKPKFILTTLWLITCLAMPAANLSDKVVKQNQQKIERFKANTGFTGTIEPIDDNRIFLRMDGTFNLPEPVDTVVFRANGNKISNYIMKFYGINRAEFDLQIPPGSQIGYSNYGTAKGGESYFFSYQQYIYGFPVVRYHNSIAMESFSATILSNTETKVEGILQIKYSKSTKLYTITNWLLLNKTPFPKPRISKKQALEIVRHETQIYWSHDENGIRAPGPGAQSAPVLRSAYLTIYSDMDNKTNNYTFKYIYGIEIIILGNPQVFLVDGMTGKMSKPEIID